MSQDRNIVSKVWKQDRACKNCGYMDVWEGNLIAKWFETSHITREPIVCPNCEKCGEPMQIYQQQGHRRIYKCWDCGSIDNDTVFYENGSERFIDQDAMTKYFHDPLHEPYDPDWFGIPHQARKGQEEGPAP